MERRVCGGGYKPLPQTRRHIFRQEGRGEIVAKELRQEVWRLRAVGHMLKGLAGIEDKTVGRINVRSLRDCLEELMADLHEAEDEFQGNADVGGYSSGPGQRGRRSPSV